MTDKREPTDERERLIRHRDAYFGELIGAMKPMYPATADEQRCAECGAKFCCYCGAKLKEVPFNGE